MRSEAFSVPTVQKRCRPVAACDVKHAPGAVQANPCEAGEGKQAVLQARDPLACENAESLEQGGTRDRETSRKPPQPGRLTAPPISELVRHMAIPPPYKLAERSA